MKKIPTVFVRKYEGHKVVDVIPEFTNDACKAAFLYGKATIKADGMCVMFQNGIAYKRYDAKKGKNPPKGAIPCCPPDPITGHWPHWVKISYKDPADKWLAAALRFTPLARNGTYEMVGKHMNGNPYHLEEDWPVAHGIFSVEVGRTYEEVREYLKKTPIEGLVFWYKGEPVCKIKRSDFGFEWPCAGARLWPSVEEQE